MTERLIDFCKVENFDSLLDIKYGKIGTKTRDKFEESAQQFYKEQMSLNQNI